MPISVYNAFCYVAYLAKQVHRHPNKHVKLALLRYLEAAEHAFIEADFYTMLRHCAYIRANLSLS